MRVKETDLQLMSADDKNSYPAPSVSRVLTIRKKIADLKGQSFNPAKVVLSDKSNEK
ncbi:MAG: hypothetical protein IJ529_00850 [Alphaproteobacteria bacterium]|nr:hypothetical protein [Alphaproteobacteria bacterium]MBQ9234840.1 hypothetical protein [Alphaproteobacteria bacterium]